jgi:citronellol/citronellal dehydrogenase
LARNITAFSSESDEVWLTVLNLNLTSTFRVTKACWSQLALTKGTVVNMSSLAALAGMSQEMRAKYPGVPPAAYGAAKAGVEAFTRYTATSGAADGIRVNCVRPGQILTPALAGPDGGSIFAAGLGSTQITPGPGGPEDVANAVLFLACDESKFVNGQILSVDGGAAHKV